MAKTKSWSKLQRNLWTQLLAHFELCDYISSQRYLMLGYMPPCQWFEYSHVCYRTVAGQIYAMGEECFHDITVVNVLTIIALF